METIVDCSVVPTGMPLITALLCRPGVHRGGHGWRSDSDRSTLLGLLTPGDVNPAALARAGFRLVGLEVPVTGSLGTVTVDVVLLHQDSLHLVLCEVKSGANVDPGQARRYAALDAAAVVQAGHVTGWPTPTGCCATTPAAPGCHSR
jgi:hypothetical protein